MLTFITRGEYLSLYHFFLLVGSRMSPKRSFAFSTSSSCCEEDPPAGPPATDSFFLAKSSLLWFLRLSFCLMAWEIRSSLQQHLLTRAVAILIDKESRFRFPSKFSAIYVELEPKRNRKRNRYPIHNSSFHK